RRYNVNHEFEFDRLFDRQGACPCALEYLVDVRCAAPEEILEVWPVGHEATEIRERPEWGDRRQSVLHREFGNLPRGVAHDGRRQHGHGLGTAAQRGADASMDIIDIATLQD